MTSIELINVVSRATLRNIGAKMSFKSLDTNVAGAFTLATIGLIGVPGYKIKKKTPDNYYINNYELTLCGFGKA